jgi:hypothetical protein
MNTKELWFSGEGGKVCYTANEEERYRYYAVENTSPFGRFVSRGLFLAMAKKWGCK